MKEKEAASHIKVHLDFGNSRLQVGEYSNRTCHCSIHFSVAIKSEASLDWMLFILKIQSLVILDAVYPHICPKLIMIFSIFF